MLSVVVPVYDVAEYLAECLDSILAQPVDLEVVAVDDASTDGSAAILDEYAARDPRVRVVRLAVNGGLGAARNIGLEHVRGEYVVFVDSDDTLAVDALATIAAAAGPDVIMFGFTRVWPDGRDEPDARSAALLTPAATTTLGERPALLDVFPSAWNKACRTSFARRFAFSPGYYEDIPWTFPVLMAAASIATIPQPLYRYRQRAGSILASSGERHLQLLDRFDEAFAYLDAHPELERWRAPLFERMTRHVPTVLETRERIPPATRRAFYAAASAAFRRHRPPGYRTSGAARVKVALVERGHYPAFRVAQLANAAARRTRDQVFPANRRSRGGNRRGTGKSRSTPNWAERERYVDAPQRWLERVEDGASRELQAELLSGLLGYLAADSGMSTVTATLPAEYTDAFHKALPKLTAAIDDDLIVEASAPAEHRLALLLGAQGRTGHGVVRTRTDRGLVRSRVYYAGESPLPVGKQRDIAFYGRVLLHERIVWAPEAVELDGAIVLPPETREPRPQRLKRILAENRGVARGVARDLRIRRAARRADEYADAWLLMDRDTTAGDNAEHLYRHLLTHENDVNAYFVLNRDSRDWPRLERDGFRLLAYGSDEHFVALLRCAHLISSQIDSYVVKPFRHHLLGSGGTGGWRYTFLQHGVTQNDLSRWINDKPVDLMVTATPDEQESIVGDGTPYVLTGLETKLTGFARHDRLATLAGTPRTTLLVMPTWRRELLGPQGVGNRRERRDGFWASDFARAWRTLLEDERLAGFGWEPVFVPHPNLEPYLDDSPLDVRTLRFSEIDVQEVLAGAGALITDYSSLAFEAAYLDRPVVYYQFDADAFFAGGHVVRRGSWSYEQQGFGPVATTVDGVVDALTEAIHDPEYAKRRRESFPFRDGRCCERIVAAIRAIPSRTGSPR